MSITYKMLEQAFIIYYIASGELYFISPEDFDHTGISFHDINDENSLPYIFQSFSSIRFYA